MIYETTTKCIQCNGQSYHEEKCIKCSWSEGCLGRENHKFIWHKCIRCGFVLSDAYNNFGQNRRKIQKGIL